MNLERFIYLDIAGVASLYAQLRGENPVETLCSIEHGTTSTLKAAIAKFIISFGGESSNTEKETRTTKTTLQPENMVREIVASLRAHGSLNTSLSDAISKTTKNHTPSWFDARHPFSVPPRLDEFNQMRAVIFVSGFPPYNDSAKDPRISMSASLHHFPSARDGQLSWGGHDALFFRKLNGQPHPFSIFGSVFECGDGFQVKPYTIRL